MSARFARYFLVVPFVFLAACASDTTGPVQNESEITVAHRDVDLVSFAEAGNSQRFVFPEPVSSTDLRPNVQYKGRPRLYTGATIESRGSILPPMVEGTPVQLTDVRIMERFGSQRGLAVSNTAGEEVRGALQLFDLSDPFAPVMLSECLVPDAEYASVVVVEGMIYALGNDADAAIVDLFDDIDPEQPVHHGRLSLDGQVAVAAHLYQETLWIVTGGEGGLHEVDVSNPMSPRFVDFTPIEDARDVTFRNPRLFVLTGQGVHVYKNDREDFVPIEGLPAEAPTRGAWFDGHWVVSTNQGLVAVDSKKYDAHLLLPGEAGTANGLSSDDDGLLFRANGEAGLQLVHRNARDEFFDLGALDLENAGSSNSVSVGDDFLLSGDGRGGILLGAFQYDVFENFEGNLFQPYPWMSVRGDWRIEDFDGSLRFTSSPREGGRDRRAFWGTSDKAWSDFRLDAKLWLDEGKGCGIYFRASDLWKDEEQDGYIFQYDPGYDTGVFMIRRIEDGEQSAPIVTTAKADIAELADTPWYGIWRDVRIEARRDRLRVWVDGVLVCDVEDDEYRAGSIGVRAWDTSQPRFDDFRVTELD